MIYLVGDVHGEKNIWKRPPLSELNDNDFVILLGDIGYLYLDNEAEHRFLDWMEENVKATVLFLVGNHDNIPAIHRYPEEIWNGGHIHKIRKNIFHLMNGYVFDIPNDTSRVNSFFVMGGAYSIDRAFRPGLWWSEELPDDEEKQIGNENLAARYYKFDYILSHCPPFDISCRFYYNIKEKPLNEYLQYVMDAVEAENKQFKHLYCAHTHESRHYKDEKVSVLGYCEIVKLE